MKSSSANSTPATLADKRVSRRGFLGGGLAAGACAGLLPVTAKAQAQTPYSPCALPGSADRLDQGPFPTRQDTGERTLAATTPSKAHIRNFGLGLTGYTWEENGPALRVRSGQQTLEQAVEQMAGLPFVDLLYIRCDWRDVQSEAGRLNLQPVWDLTLDAARRHGLRVAFRVQMSNPQFEPQQLALPDFLQKKVPLAHIGRRKFHGREVDFVEPRYDSPAFQSAFQELNELLADRFDGNPLIEYMDLMMYGFWGEGHTHSMRGPFSDFPTAQKTFLHLTRMQLEIWKKTQLAVNTQPDTSMVGNAAVVDLAMRSGCWLRSDSIIEEEPIQIDELGNRPPWLGVVMEDGAHRDYNIATIPVDSAGINERENAMLHVLDLGGNYWSLWTEAENLEAYNQRYPDGFRALQQRMGYRIRPAWVWQRKRWDTTEVIVGVANDGVAGVPGVLRLTLASNDGAVLLSGTLDAGQPFAGKIRQAAFVLPAGTGDIDLKLSVQLETKGGLRRPVQWACQQPLNADGSFPVQAKAISTPGWL
jgi:hypothetical protein